ncbi:MAG: formate dehydrogenase accessory protein FdhE [Desulfurococcales archaeon]|nr:formate dehydrogenase accessory protein FdhE [Desulfurococcales archaeon]
MGGDAPEARLARFRTALLRYRGLAGVAIDLETAVRVEEVELGIIESLKPAVREAVEAGESLNSLAARLLEEGTLSRLAGVVAEKLGLEGPRDLGDALQRMASGDIEAPGAKVAFVVMQAVARAYAEVLLEAEGPREVMGTRCPVCGAESDVMAAEPDGGYSMVCPFCFYKWRLPGVGLSCPSCGSRDRFALGIYTGRSDKRVALLHCQNCGFTARVILDRNVASGAPRSLLPLIALRADRYRAFVGEA